MYNFNILIEKEWEYYVARNLQLWVVSQWSSYEESLANIKEASELYLEWENENNLIKSFVNRNYSLTNISI